MTGRGIHHQLVVVDQTGQSQVGGAHQQMFEILPRKPRFEMNLGSVGGVQYRPAANVHVASPQEVQRPPDALFALPPPPVPIVYSPQEQPRLPARGVGVQPGQPGHRRKPAEHVQRVGGGALDEMLDALGDGPPVGLAARRRRRLRMRRGGGRRAPPSANRFRQKTSASPVGSVAAQPSAALAATAPAGAGAWA